MCYGALRHCLMSFAVRWSGLVVGEASLLHRWLGKRCGFVCKLVLRV